MRFGFFLRALLPRDVAQALAINRRGQKRQNDCEPPRNPRQSPSGPQKRDPRSHGFFSYLGCNANRDRRLQAIDVDGVVRVSNGRGCWPGTGKTAARAQFFGDFSGFYIGGGAEDGGTGL